jgi:predicted nuclease of predicted toxin-antitoxin system
MLIRFLADADLNEDIVTGLVRLEPRINFQTAQAANLRELSDPEVLAMAAQENRILVTHDRRTMPHHFADFILRQSSPGVFVIAQSISVRVAIEELLLVWTASDSEEWVNLIVSLPL